jgi:thiol-disulfide isomerase/thioredoxin
MRGGSFRAFIGLLLVLVAVPLVAQSEIELPGLDGGTLTAADLAKGRVVLVVWASWSPKCRDIVQRVNDLDEKWRGRARLVTVNFQEDRSEVAAYLQGQMRAATYLDSDGAFAKAHAVATLPGLVVYVEGRPVYQGRLPADGGDSLLADLLQ